MASTQRDLLDDFATLANAFNEASTDYSGLQIGNTDPPAQTKTVGQASATSSTSGGSAGKTFLDVLKNESGVGALIGGIYSLFGGGGSSQPPPLVKYAMPAALDIEAADTGQGLSNADYDQMGAPRAYSGRSGSAPANRAVPGAGGGASPGQITVNVQAMDARSFLDRSADIAAAVRDAMLNLNTINDVVTDL
jgi:hypothetical protein